MDHQAKANSPLERLIRKINLTADVINCLLESDASNDHNNYVVEKKLGVLEDLVANIPRDQPDLVSKYNAVVETLWAQFVHRDETSTEFTDQQTNSGSTTSAQGQELKIPSQT